MQFVSDRFNYLFKSTKGLILVAIAMIGLGTALFGMLSGPMAELGLADFWPGVRRLVNDEGPLGCREPAEVEKK